MKQCYLFLLLTVVLSSCSGIINVLTKSRDAVSENSQSTPISYVLWDELLQKHVKDNGRVDYKGFIKDTIELNEFLALIEHNHPNEKHWSTDEQLAYWINAYNAYTVKLIVDNYPVSSIKKIKSGVPFINSVWDKTFIEIEDKSYSLNNIEHGILRSAFDEPRIHFAVNCASISCPNLMNEAFFPERLDEQLHKTGTLFLNDSSKNSLSPERLGLSKIFKWYKSDFTKTKSLKEYVAQFLEEDISNKKIGFEDYDWNLNDVE